MQFKQLNKFDMQNWSLYKNFQLRSDPIRFDSILCVVSGCDTWDTHMRQYLQSNQCELPFQSEVNKNQKPMWKKCQQTCTSCSLPMRCWSSAPADVCVENFGFKALRWSFCCCSCCCCLFACANRKRARERGSYGAVEPTNTRAFWTGKRNTSQRADE